MTLFMDRRSVLTSLGALGVMGCSPQTENSEQNLQTPPPPAPLNREVIDFSTLEARRGGRLGFAARDMATGRFLDWRGDERFVYCSTFKLYLAAATLLRVQRGEERLDRAIPITQADMLPTAPVTEAALGSSLTVEALMKGTVEVSDNPAANILLREMGGLETMQAFYRGILDTSTRVDRFEMELNIEDGDKDTITPVQSALNLQRLFLRNDAPLTPTSREKLLGWLFASPTGVDRIKAGVPTGWRVAHKTGTGRGPTNDIGLAYPPSGESVVIAAYYHATSASTPAEREAVIAEATRMALTALGHIA